MPWIIGETHIDDARRAHHTQTVLTHWFAEPAICLAKRVAANEAFHDDRIEVFCAVGMRVRSTEAGSCVHLQLPG